MQSIGNENHFHYRPDFTYIRYQSQELIILDCVHLYYEEFLRKLLRLAELLHSEHIPKNCSQCS